jgi:hypothetical protein
MLRVDSPDVYPQGCGARVCKIRTATPLSIDWNDGFHQRQPNCKKAHLAGHKRRPCRNHFYGSRALTRPGEVFQMSSSRTIGRIVTARLAYAMF